MGMEGKGGEKGRGSSLRASSLAAGIGGRNGWGGAVRDLARRLDPGRVLLLSFWKKRHLPSVRHAGYHLVLIF